MSNLLLMHGAWGGAWEFQETIKGLQELGHRASAIDLPVHGEAEVPISEVTMEAYVRAVPRQGSVSCAPGSDAVELGCRPGLHA